MFSNLLNISSPLPPRVGGWGILVLFALNRTSYLSPVERVLPLCHAIHANYRMLLTLVKKFETTVEFYFYKCFHLVV